MKSSVHWARQLVASTVGDPQLPPDPPVLRAFAENYLEMVLTHEHLVESVVSHAERLASAYEVARVDVTPATALRILVGDLLAGMHMGDVEPLAHSHPDGGTYLLLGPCAVKDDVTGEWIDGVMYRDARGGPICTTSQQRWDDRFTPPPAGAPA